MTRTLGWRFWLEFGLAGLGTLLFLLTFVWRDWIEAVFRLDPDRGGGWLEWLTAVALLAASATFARLARAEHRRAVEQRPAAAEGGR